MIIGDTNFIHEINDKLERIAEESLRDIWAEHCKPDWDHPSYVKLASAINTIAKMTVYDFMGESGRVTLGKTSVRLNKGLFFRLMMRRFDFEPTLQQAMKRRIKSLQKMLIVKLRKLEKEYKELENV